MLRSVLLILSLLAAAPVWAVAAGTNNPAPSAVSKTQDKSDQMPDAMKHLLKAPNVDYTKLRDPFASYLVTMNERGQQLLQERRKNLSSRPREALENFALASLKLVAIYQMGADRVAMIQDPEGKGYIVHRGNYMGKNNGRIEKINGQNLYLVEQVLNPAGEITDRQVTLTLKTVNTNSN